MTGRALVTGGAGFIGLHLTRRLLLDGWSVVIVDDLSRGARDHNLDEVLSSGRVDVCEADLREPASVESVTTDFTLVVHAAAIVGVAAVIERPMSVLRDNVAMLEVALDVAARQPALGRFVFASTSEVYAGTQEEHGIPFPTPESVALTLPPFDRPRTSYMLSKLYGEALCHQSGLPFTILRPHNVYGPRMGSAHVVPQLAERIHAAASGSDVVVYSPDHRRTFCYVDDAVEHIARLATSPDAAGGTFNIGAESPEVTMEELAHRLLAVAGRDDLTLIGGTTTSGSPARRCPDMSRTTATTGYRGEVDLDEGLRRTWAWYHDNAFGAPSEH